MKIENEVSLHTQGYYYVKDNRIYAKYSNHAYNDAPAVLFDYKNGQVHSIDSAYNLRKKLPSLLNTIKNLPLNMDFLSNLCHMEYDYEENYVTFGFVREEGTYITIDDYCTILNFITYSAYTQLDTLESLILSKDNTISEIKNLQAQGF